MYIFLVDRNLVKRQLTWFRNEGHSERLFNWIDATQPLVSTNLHFPTVSLILRNFISSTAGSINMGESIHVDLQYTRSLHYMVLVFASVFYASLGLRWQIWKETTSAEVEFQKTSQHLHI